MADRESGLSLSDLVTGGGTHDVRMPDGTIIRNVPRGTTKAQLATRYAKTNRNAYEPKYGLGDYIAHSATMGADAYTNGLASGVMNAIEAPFSKKVDFHPLQAFNDARRHTIDRANKYASDNPVRSTIGGLTGAFVSAPGKLVASALTRSPGIIGKMVQSAKIAAPAAAVNAAANTKDFNQMPESAAFGGLAGGILGAGMPLTGALVSPITKGIRALLSHGQGRASEKIVDALTSDNVTPAMAGNIMDAAHSRGVPRMLGDAGENTSRLLAAASRQPGPARTMIRGALKDRQRAQGSRLQNALSRDFGEVGNVQNQSDAIMEAARAAAAPLYKKANANLVPETPELRALLSTPAGKAALSRAHTIALNERANPMELGFALDREGNVALNPPNLGLHSDLAGAKSTLDDATLALEKAKRAVLGGGGSAGKVPELEKAVAKARVDYDAAQGSLSAAPSPGTAATQPVYSQKTLDYVKKGLDSVLEDSRDKVTGKLRLDDVSRSVDGVRKSFLRVVDELNPDYPPARAVFAGHAKQADALHLGQEMANASEGDIQRAVSRMNDSEREQFALGMRSKLSDNLHRRVDGSDKVSYLSASPQRRDILQQVAGPNANVPRFFDTLADEDAAGETYRTAMTGSPTAINLADDDAMKDGHFLADTTGRLIRGAKSGGFFGAIANVAAPVFDAARFGVGRTGDRVRQDLAALLTETEPAAFANILKGLSETQRVQAARKARYGIFGMQGNNAAGALTGQFVGSVNQ